MKEGMFSKLGKKVNSVMASTDEVIGQAIDKVNDTMKKETPEYITDNFTDMDLIVEHLNELETVAPYKSFKVIAIVPTDEGLSMLMRVVHK